VDLEIVPEQPEGVGLAIGVVLNDVPTGPDPWWQAGLEEALET